MNGSQGLELLFQYAGEYRFADFTGLLRVLEASLPLEEFWEAYLMRAQIKLYAVDETILSDLEKISHFSGPPQFPRLSDIWRNDSPNRFIVFPKAPGVLAGFLALLPQVRQQLSRWYGQAGEFAARLVQAEIRYFLGDIRPALDLVEEQHRSGLKNNIEAILTQCLRFRCYLALSCPRPAEECMLDMIRLSQAHPECLATYRALRGWANLTTNWNGDTRRFYNDPDGKRVPVLDDRLEDVRMGSARTTPLEEPFLSYAVMTYENAYAIRQFYMDLLHAMYWFQAGDQQQAESYFLKLYRISAASGLIMPIVECGDHITPLLRYVKDSGWDCCPLWLDRVIERAGQYEKSLNAYQYSDT